MTARVSCADCVNYRRGSGLYTIIEKCHAFQEYGPLPVQGRKYDVELYTAWAQCRGKKFQQRRPWWKRLWS